MKTSKASTSISNGVSVCVFDTISAAEAVWRDFENASDHYVFQTYDWLSHWHKHIGVHEKIDPYIVLLSDEKCRPLVLLPLAIQEKNRIRRLVWLGGLESDYHGPLLATEFSSRVDQEAFIEMWSETLESLPGFDVVLFEKQPATIGGQNNPFVALKCTPYSENAYFTRLEGSWQDYYRSKRSRNTRKRLRNYENGLGKHGELSFHVLNKTTEIGPAAEQLFTLKRRRYRETGVRDLLEEVGHEEFYKSATLDAPISEKVKIAVLRVDSNIAAATIFAVYNGRLYDLYPAFDSVKFGKYGAGVVLLIRNMQWCFDNDIKIYDLTIGNDQYKEEWCEETVPLFYYMSSKTSKGWCLISYRRLRDRLKQLAWLNFAVRTARRLRT